MHALFEWLLDGLSPRRCLGCGEPSVPSWCRVCGEPERLSQPETLGSTPLLAAGSYSGALGSAIRRFKYQGHPELAAPLGALLTEVAVPLGPFEKTVFVPVPLHFERLVERGFNQSALLARAIARNTGARCLPRLLARRRATEHQARLGRPERQENLRGALQVRGTASGSVILVDDVVTTGATAQACIEALEKRDICVRAVLALARTLHE